MHKTHSKSRASFQLQVVFFTTTDTIVHVHTVEHSNSHFDTMVKTQCIYKVDKWYLRDDFNFSNNAQMRGESPLYMEINTRNRSLILWPSHKLWE